MRPKRGSSSELKKTPYEHQFQTCRHPIEGVNVQQLYFFSQEVDMFALTPWFYLNIAVSPCLTATGENFYGPKGDFKEGSLRYEIEHGFRREYMEWLPQRIAVCEAALNTFPRTEILALCKQRDKIITETAQTLARATNTDLETILKTTIKNILEQKPIKIGEIDESRLPKGARNCTRYASKEDVAKAMMYASLVGNFTSDEIKALAQNANNNTLYLRRAFVHLQLDRTSLAAQVAYHMGIDSKDVSEIENRLLEKEHRGNYDYLKEAINAYKTAIVALRLSPTQEPIWKETIIQSINRAEEFIDKSRVADDLPQFGNPWLYGILGVYSYAFATHNIIGKLFPDKKEESIFRCNKSVHDFLTTLHSMSQRSDKPKEGARQISARFPDMVERSILPDAERLAERLRETYLFD